MRAISKTALFIAVVLLAVWLLNDAMTFALYAPSAGRAGGCYTTIEVWLGASQPDDRVRTAEVFLGLGLLVTGFGRSVLAGFRLLRHRRRAT